MSQEEVFVFPVSFAQQRLWFLDQLAPGTCLYNVPTVIRLVGALNKAALESSVNEIVRRHEALRTTFGMVEGQPIQAIAPSAGYAIAPALSISLPAIDLQELPAAQREAEAKRLVTEETQRPFNLSRGPLLRLLLLQLGEAEYLLVLNLHHIVFDDWSMGVLIRELGALYTAFISGKSCPLRELPIQYADFAIWQREWLQGEVLADQLAYWQQQLDSIPVLNLPCDRPRRTLASYRGATQLLELKPSLTKALEALSQQSGVTLFMTLLAAFQTLLYRYTHQEDIAVGSPIANRNRSELESLIGFFVNSLVLRTDLSGNPTFRELLVRVREVALGAYAHQDLPFEKLVQELQPNRDSSRNPLFSVVFALQNAPMDKLELPGLTLSCLDFETRTTRFDLELYLWECSDNFRSLWGEGWEPLPGLRGVMVYNTDLFDKATITRMLGHFQTLLEGIVANPEERLADLPLLDAVERHTLLVEWNDIQRISIPNRDLYTPAASTLDKIPHSRRSDVFHSIENRYKHCIHERFEVQVERSPSSIAVAFEDEQLTYRELNARSNQLAHYLQKLGVGSEVSVGICVERSALMVVGLLGILKAGGAYVPLDPTYPKERLHFMLEDAQVSVLLTEQRWTEHFHGANVVCLDKDWEVIATESEENPISQAIAETTAYIIYTSGSTGKPKGVAVPHRAVNRLVCNTNYVQLEPADKVAQSSNISFDAATFEIWGALLCGAQLVGINRDVALSPQDFAAQIRQQEISVLFLTTALFNAIASVAPWAFSSLRYLLFGGEAVDPKSVQEVLKHGAPGQLLHVYGPTESTTFASWYRVQDVPEGATSIPIGRPIANTQIYLLDAHLHPVPIGVTGELYIGGAGLARGYLNRPELTTRFIPNPFSSEPGTRLYKTGDLARLRSDGNIEFLGRIDDQVKIRGFRIELGEILAVLSQHPAVLKAFVMVRDVAGDKRMVAYIVPRQEQVPTTSELRCFLKSKLPDYMIPSAFVVIEALPLTPNGKVNRDALPTPNLVTTELAAVERSPRTSHEEELVRIWTELLGLERVGVQDNFFELGGHSLLATQLLSRVRNTFGVEVPLRSLFETPTVEAIAKYIETVSWANKGFQALSSTMGEREEEEF